MMIENGWTKELERLRAENAELVEERDKLAKENEAYKDLFERMRNLVEAVGE